MICNTCNRPDHSPFRIYDERGKVKSGCVADCHTGHLIPISESNRWHLRPEAKRIRRITKARLSGKKDWALMLEAR